MYRSGLLPFRKGIESLESAKFISLFSERLLKDLPELREIGYITHLPDRTAFALQRGRALKNSPELQPCIIRQELEARISDLSVLPMVKKIGLRLATFACIPEPMPTLQS